MAQVRLVTPVPLRRPLNAATPAVAAEVSPRESFETWSPLRTRSAWEIPKLIASS